MNEPTPKLDHREIEHDTACSSLRLKRHFACVQTSPISFVARGTKEIGDVCTQAKRHLVWSVIKKSFIS